jgi:hypothetical protein
MLLLRFGRATRILSDMLATHLKRRGQAIKLEPPMQHMEELEGQALRECLPPISGTSMLGKALVLLTGVMRVVIQQEICLLQAMAPLPGTRQHCMCAQLKYDALDRCVLLCKRTRRW